MFAYELFKVKIKIVNNTRNTYIWVKIHLNCSQIIVVHVHAKWFYLKFTQRVTKLHTVSNQEVASKQTDKHAADCSKVVCCGVS